MPPFHKFIIVLVVVTAAFAAAAGAKADSVTFNHVVVLQNGGSTRVDLLSHPGVTVTGPRISFLVDIHGNLPAGVTSLLRITYTVAGAPPIVQTYTIPAFGSVPPPYSQLFTIDSPRATAQGTPAKLTVSIISPPGFSVGPAPGHFFTHTYTFNVAQPVPEPATMVLLGSGVLGLLAKARLRRNHPRKQL